MREAPGAQRLREKITFLACPDADRRLVRFVTEQTGLVPADPPEAQADRLLLRADADGLALVKGGLCLRGDFSKALPRLRPNALNRELLVRAARPKRASGALTAVDATAGLGEDAILLAAAGFHVTLLERDPIIGVLLCDALCRGAEDPELAPIVGRMAPRIADSVAVLPRLDEPPDVVVLDPMFPTRQKSGLVKKKFQLLHDLERPCENEEELLRAAMACHPRKIVIKRPARGPCLAGQKPSYSIRGQTIRYDCIVRDMA